MRPSHALTLVVLTLAACRIVRLVTVDDVTERFRLWFARRLGPTAELFITCPWCAGSWLSFATVAVAAQFVSVPSPALVALAVAFVVGFVVERTA